MSEFKTSGLREALEGAASYLETQTLEHSPDCSYGATNGPHGDFCDCGLKARRTKRDKIYGEIQAALASSRTAAGPLDMDEAYREDLLLVVEIGIRFGARQPYDGAWSEQLRIINEAVTARRHKRKAALASQGGAAKGKGSVEG